MEPEHTLNKEILIKNNLFQAVQKKYGLAFETLKFLLRGWGGDCFLGETCEGESFFIKVHDKEVNVVFAASSRTFYLPLMYQLHTKGILPHIPHPVRTLEGDLSLVVGDQMVVITGFIKGEDVGFGALPEGIINSLGNRVRRLHTCLPQLKFEAPLIEGFEIAFELALLEYLTALKSVRPNDSEGQQLLQEVLLERTDEVLYYLKQLKKRQAYAKKAHFLQVICHTDLHGGNLRLDADGNLYILDWENAMIAPREQDMIFFMGEADYREAFWSAYCRHYPQAELDLKILEFYFLRRGLEDLTDYIFRIMAGDGGLERDQSDLHELMECLDGFRTIEPTIAEIQAFLLGG